MLLQVKLKCLITAFLLFQIPRSKLFSNVMISILLRHLIKNWLIKMPIMSLSQHLPITIRYIITLIPLRLSRLLKMLWRLTLLLLWLLNLLFLLVLLNALKKSFVAKIFSSRLNFCVKVKRFMTTCILLVLSWARSQSAQSVSLVCWRKGLLKKILIYCMFILPRPKRSSYFLIPI